MKPCDIISFESSTTFSHFIYLTGFGGQIDFVRGAALSLDGEGKPIIACTSTTDDGVSRIVPTLKEGEISICFASVIIYIFLKSIQVFIV